MHRKATVVLVGACVLWVALAGVALANEFYQTGEAKEVQGADNLGKTVVHYAVTLGFPMLSAGLMTGGLIKMRRDPGVGGGLLASGGAAGYLGSIVNNLHSDAAAAVLLASLPSGLHWSGLVVSLVAQAACAASIVCAVRRRAGRDVETL